MSWELFWVLGLLASAMLMFTLNRPRMDVVGLLMIAILPFTGTITIQEALAGFSDPNVVLIALLFVLGDGLVRTGVARRMGDWIYKTSSGSETKLLILLMLAVGLSGSFMSSTAVVAIFIPVVLRICQSNGMAPAKLMMPLSMAGLISGMMTLVATAPNLIVQGELIRQGEKGFSLFSVTPFGLICLALAVLYMLWAKRWLPEGHDADGSKRERPTFRQWIERYQLDERERRVRVRSDSILLKQRLEAFELREYGAHILAIERVDGRRRKLVRPSRATMLQADDVLLVDLRGDTDIEQFLEEMGLEALPLGATHRYLMDHTQDLGMIEAIVTAESRFIGHTVIQANIRLETGLTVIGLRRGQTVFANDMLDEPLRIGDTLLLTGFWEDIQVLSQDGSDLLPLALPRELSDVLPAHDRAFHALGILALVIILMLSGVIRNVHAVLIGCLLLGAFRCMDMKSAYQSINWKTLVLIVGMMPFSLALQRTGGVALAADLLANSFGDGSPRLVLGLLFLITAVIGMGISNTATAILMAPIALSVAQIMGLSPYPFAMAVGLGASCAFMTPVSSPVNTLVMGPGNYRFIDFVRLGVPFAILVLIVSVVLIPVLLPF
ncbi:MAG: anion permease [Kiritimatiellae bacterium]|nr:anion permease [Kiritimatiellia bacterium]